MHRLSGRLVDRRGILSWARNHGQEIMGKKSWARNHGQEIMGKKSWARNHGQEIMGKKSFKIRELRPIPGTLAQILKITSVFLPYSSEIVTSAVLFNECNKMKVC